MGEGRSAGRQELQGSIADHPGLSECLLASGDGQVGNDLGSGEDVGSVEHLGVRERPFALLRHGVHPGREAADLLDVAAGSGAEMDVGRPAQVGHGDDRGHGPPAISDPLEELERPFEAVARRLHDRRDR